MSLTSRFIAAHKKHPDWSYRELADFLGVSTNVLRGYNARIKPKLPIPVKDKAPNGQAKKRVRRRVDGKRVTIFLPHEPKPTPVQKAIRKALFTPPAQTGSGRKTYGGYLKLL